ncbi:MAG: tetratricopeptide repeat-containing sensor histidine kinase [Bacteroidia bacterium]
MVKKRLKQLLFSCFFILILVTNSLAQTTRVEELLRQIDKNSPDTSQIKVLRKLSAAYSAVDPVKKFYYANQYRLLGEKNGIDSVVSAGYLDMGISYGIRSKVDSALYYFKLGYEKAKESNYEIGIARSHANIGYAYDRLEKKKEAVKHYEASLKIFRKLKIKKSINQNITNLGSLYFDLGEYKIADNYFKQVLANVKETPNDEMGLANALFTLGNSSRELGRLGQSLNYYQKSLAIRSKLGDLNGIALNNWGLGLLYNRKKEYKRAIGHFEIAIKNNKVLKNSYQECVAYKGLSQAYLGLKDYKKAEEFSTLALSKANESGSKGLVSECLSHMVDVKSAQNKFQEALKFQSDFIAVNDSLDVSKTKKEVILNDIERVNKDNQDLELNNQQISSRNTDYITVISVVTVLLIVLLIVSFLYYRKNTEMKSINALLQKQKQEIAEVNEELGALNEELSTQMDIVSTQNLELEKLNQVKNKFFSIVSHDLRSPMNSLKMLFELYREGDLDKEELNKLTARLEDTIYTTATFLDSLLEWSRSQLDGMVVKPSLVNLNQIITENIKLADSQINMKHIVVQNNVTQEKKAYVDGDMFNIVIRNLLSNAIKFCSANDQIFFDAKLEAKNMIVSIRDTGPGISDAEQSNLFQLSHTSTTGTTGEKGYHIGLILCKDMVVQNNGKIEVQSKVGQGTTFIITLPLSS